MPLGPVPATETRAVSPVEAAPARDRVRALHFSLDGGVRAIDRLNVGVSGVGGLAIPRDQPREPAEFEDATLTRCGAVIGRTRRNARAVRGGRWR